MSSDDSSEKQKKGPIHLLMTSAVSPLQQQVLLDPRLQTDYVAKRAKLYGRSSSKNSSSLNKKRKSAWDGVSRVERKLVFCCEKVEQNDDDDEYDDYFDTLDEDKELGGVLDVDKEVQFAGILARDCNTFATKCLALAILERTMRLYLQEEDSDDDESEDEELDNVPSDDENDCDYQPGSKRHRSQNDKSDQQSKRQKIQEENDKEDEEEEEEEEEYVGRLERFLAAGGLKILNRWLIDASAEEPIIALKKSPGSSNGSNSAPKRKPPPTRPLILPILRFLVHIPFDKKAVMNSNINKQIRNLGKEIDAIRKSKQENRHDAVDVANWSFQASVSDEDALDKVAVAVKDVKATWGVMAKEDPRLFEDPFSPFKAVLKEKLDTLVQVEVGAIPKPEWLDETEVAATRKKPPKPRKSNTQELAARERHAEKENLKQKLQAAQKEHSERLAQLRQKLGRRKEEVAPLVKQYNGTRKSVVWKDGLRSQVNRNRKMLEEVFVFIKNTPAAKNAESDESVDNVPAQNGVKESKKQEKPAQLTTVSIVEDDSDPVF